MAFSKTPIAQSYQTKSVKLLNSLDKRSAEVDKDADYLNSFFELQQNKATGDADAHVVKRAGTSNFSDAFASNNVRGIFHWEDNDRVYIAVDDDIVVVNATTGAIVTTLNAVFATSSGPVGFTEFYYTSAAVKIVATDGLLLVTIDSANTVVPNADVDIPTPHLPQPIYLDGYLFLVKANSADIYNSNLDNPLAWTPGDFISCEMFPDLIRYIAKLNNYLVAFGSESIEYFWDAGVASGSPLQRNDTPVKLVGYMGGFAQYGNQIYFIGKANQTTPTVYQLEDFKIKDVGTESIRKYLQIGGNLLTSTGSTVSFSGHDFYVMVSGSYTYVLDMKTELWQRWSYRNTNTFPVTASYTNDVSSGNKCILHLTGQDRLFLFDSDTYRDIGQNFTFRIVTDKEYFDTLNQKTMARASLWCDWNGPSSIVSLSYTDNDYQTYSTPVSIELNQELPCTYRLGRFRKRAFKLEYTDNFPLRIERLEVDINIGQT